MRTAMSTSLPMAASVVACTGFSTVMTTLEGRGRFAKGSAARARKPGKCRRGTKLSTASTRTAAATAFIQGTSTSIGWRAFQSMPFTACATSSCNLARNSGESLTWAASTWDSSTADSSFSRNSGATASAARAAPALSRTRLRNCQAKRQPTKAQPAYAAKETQGRTASGSNHRRSSSAISNNKPRAESKQIKAPRRCKREERRARN